MYNQHPQFFVSPAAFLVAVSIFCAADGSWVRQLTGTVLDRLDRWGGRITSLIEDADPCYLPDDGVAFVTTRCQGFGRCHNGRYTPALLLYRCDQGADPMPRANGDCGSGSPRDSDLKSPPAVSHVG